MGGHGSKILAYLFDFVMDPKLFWASFLVSVRSMSFFSWSYLVEWASVNYRGIFWDDKRKDSLYLSSVALTRWIGWDRKAPPNWSDNNVLGHKLWVMTAATAANSYTLLGSSSYCKIMPVIPVWISSTVIKDPSVVHLDFYLTFYVTMPLPLKLLARGSPVVEGAALDL